MTGESRMKCHEMDCVLIEERHKKNCVLIEQRMQKEDLNEEREEYEFQDGLVLLMMLNYCEGGQRLNGHSVSIGSSNMREYIIDNMMLALVEDESNGIEVVDNANYVLDDIRMILDSSSFYTYTSNASSFLQLER
ncbi:hypothetical protein KI387_030886, partial [Taxus chinensis]